MLREISSSTRLCRNVTEITLHWMFGIPTLPSCVTSIIHLPLQNLAVLRYRDVPLTHLNPVAEQLPPRPLRYVKTLDLGYSRFRATTWTHYPKVNPFAYLTSFCRIDSLFLRGVGPIVISPGISHAGDSNLEVHTLHLDCSSPRLLNYLASIFSPSSLRKLVIRGRQQYSIYNVSVAIVIGSVFALNKFLDACGQELEMISLSLPVGDDTGDGTSDSVLERLFYLSQHITRTYVTLKLSCKLPEVTGGRVPCPVVQRTSCF